MMTLNDEITLAIALGALICNVVLTALALLRACQTRKDVQVIIKKLNGE